MYHGDKLPELAAGVRLEWFRYGSRGMMPRAFGKERLQWSVIGWALVAIVIIVLIVLWATGVF